ncbi:hypothetical protein GOODEAATRI_028783, partial [Goodea atripinnis]
MPWLVRVLPRLPKRMRKARRFLVLVFVSCVGMLMNHDFIAFDKLKHLIIDMGFFSGFFRDFRSFPHRCFLKSLALTCGSRLQACCYHQAVGTKGDCHHKHGQFCEARLGVQRVCKLSEVLQGLQN